MTLNELPIEIVRKILWMPDLPPLPPDRKISDIRHLGQLRLVCGRWNSLVSAQLFHTLVLDHGGQHKFARWNHMADSRTIREAARLVVIENVTETQSNDFYDTWVAWEMDGNYPAFTQSMNRIVEMNNLDAVQVSFKSCPVLLDLQHRVSLIYDSPSALKNTLIAVFAAIKSRADSNCIAHHIKSLIIKNLPVVPLLEFTSSQLFKDVTDGLDGLQLQLVGKTELHLDGIQWNSYDRACSILQQYWLQPFSSHLVTLTLGFLYPWGSIPFLFSGDGLAFPQLKNLTLQKYMITHHEQYFWILNQKSLKSLTLQNCFIVSHFCLLKDDFENWEVPSHDWYLFLDGAFGFDPLVEVVFGFSGAWETVFDFIRCSLPNLEHFDLRYGATDLIEPREPALSLLRYAACDATLLRNGPGDLEDIEVWRPPIPTPKSDDVTLCSPRILSAPWIQADERTGELEFGDNNQKGDNGDADYGEQPREKLPKLNLNKEREYGDRRGLEDLVEAVKQRTRCKI